MRGRASWGWQEEQGQDSPVTVLAILQELGPLLQTPVGPGILRPVHVNEHQAPARPGTWWQAHVCTCMHMHTRVFPGLAHTCTHTQQDLLGAGGGTDC